MRILLLTRYGRLGASSRQRMLQYVPYLERADITVISSALLDEGYLQQLYSKRTRPIGEVVRGYWMRVKTLLKARRFDAVWLEKELFPWAPFWLEQSMMPRGTPLIVDYDDAIFHLYDQHRSALVRRAFGAKIDRIMRSADVVVAGNEYLAARAEGAGAKSVKVIPTAVDLERYGKPQSGGVRTGFTIGWIGSPMTSRYLRGIESALETVCGADDARVALIGADSNSRWPFPTMHHGWSEETEADDIRRFDVGIMPLPDAAWERGKCGYKLIQYMACGKPVVASPVGVNRTIVKHGENGFLAASAEEWVTALRILHRDEQLRSRMGHAARRTVESQYSVEVTAPRIVDIFSRGRGGYLQGRGDLREAASGNAGGGNGS